HRNGVLDRPRSPVARKAAIYAHRTWLGQHAALSVSEHRRTRAQLTRSAAFASIGVAALLGALKLWAVLQTDSTAMLGSLADTALDLVASVATLIGVWVA